MRNPYINNGISRIQLETELKPTPDADPRIGKTHHIQDRYRGNESFPKGEQNAVKFYASACRFELLFSENILQA